MGGPAARAWGMEGSVIRSQLNASAVPLRSQAANANQEQTGPNLITPEAEPTSDYIAIVLRPSALVDRPAGSISAVLPVALVGLVVVPPYLPVSLPFLHES